MANFIQGFKSRIREYARSAPAPKPTDPDEEEGEGHDFIRTWDKNEPWGLAGRLRAVRLFPHFLVQPASGEKFVDVDMRPVLEGLRHTSRGMDLRHQAIANGQLVSRDDAVWSEGGPTVIFLAFTKTHIRSFPNHIDDSKSDDAEHELPPLITTWPSINVCVGLYLHSCMGLWNDGEEIEIRLFRRLLQIVRHDLKKTEDRLKDLARDDRNLWLWKALTAESGLAQRDTAEDSRTNPGTSLMVYKTYLDQSLRQWSKVARIKDWKAVKMEMSRITWPNNSPNDSIMEKLWNSAVSYE